MIEIRFTVPHPRHGELEWEPIATIRVEGTRFELQGDESFAEVRDIEVLDLESGQTVVFDADPERWARNLPQAFRSGDLTCEVFDESGVGLSSRALAARA